jgi:hypothetical protein
MARIDGYDDNKALNGQICLLLDQVKMSDLEKEEFGGVVWRVEVDTPEWLGVQLSVPESCLTIQKPPPKPVAYVPGEEHPWSRENALVNPQKKKVLADIEARKEDDVNMSEDVRKLAGGEGYDQVTYLYSRGEYMMDDDVYQFRSYAQKHVSQLNTEEFEDYSSEDEEDDAERE